MKRNKIKSMIPPILFMLCAAISLGLTGCGSSSGGEKGEVVVYNGGEYRDPDSLDVFEDETGMHVM